LVKKVLEGVYLQNYGPVNLEKEKKPLREKKKKKKKIRGGLMFFSGVSAVGEKKAKNENAGRTCSNKKKPIWVKGPPSGG